jgi:two-component system sensor histidine kinase BaeS
MKRASLRSRLVAAIVVVALGALGVSYVVTYALVRRSLQQNALSNLKERAGELESLSADQQLATLPAARINRALKLTDFQLVRVTPAGQAQPLNATSPGLPAPLRDGDVLPQSLLKGDEVSGRRNNTVFLAIPTERHAPNGDLITVVATDTVDMSVLHKLFPLLLFAGLIVLALAFAVASWLARRLMRPVREVERAAGQLAAGDLSARAEVPPETDAELAALAQTLNDMAAGLEDAHENERAFLLSISHDLRTPLTSIRGYADALADGTLDDADPNDRKRAATVIGSEARRLERLVRDLLDLARLDSHQFSLNMHTCDATELVKSSVDAFAPQAAELGVRLSMLSSQPLPVEADAERLAQVVANLVENALKYANGRVDVYTAQYSPGEVAIVVTDDGPGIPPDKLSRVFDRLYTVRDAPGRAVGTGLGLAIVRELAAAMGGRAWADSEGIGGGSRFVVALPSRAVVQQ